LLSQSIPIVPHQGPIQEIH